MRDLRVGSPASRPGLKRDSAVREIQAFDGSLAKKVMKAGLFVAIGFHWQDDLKPVGLATGEVLEMPERASH